MTLTPQWFKNLPLSKSASKADPTLRGLPLIHAVSGFTEDAGSLKMASEILRASTSRVVLDVNVDRYFDYRARRPQIEFEEDHYHGFKPPKLAIRRTSDAKGRPFLLLSGPEPDFGWIEVSDLIIDFIERNEISEVIGLGAVPMGVPPTRPRLLTVHATDKQLLDRENPWRASLTLPSSFSSVLEQRLGERGIDALGYVVHVPHLVLEMTDPRSVLTLLDAVADRLGFEFDLDKLSHRVERAEEAHGELLSNSEAAELVARMEWEYDRRAMLSSMQGDLEALPTGDELAEEFEAFLANERNTDES